MNYGWLPRKNLCPHSCDLQKARGGLSLTKCYSAALDRFLIISVEDHGSVKKGIIEWKRIIEHWVINYWKCNIWEVPRVPSFLCWCREEENRCRDRTQGWCGRMFYFMKTCDSKKPTTNPGSHGKQVDRNTKHRLHTFNQRHQARSGYEKVWSRIITIYMRSLMQSFLPSYWRPGAYYTTRCECDCYRPFQNPSDITSGSVHLDALWIDRSTSLTSGL